MKKIPILIAGMPGNMGRIIAGLALDDNRFFVVGASLTGPEISEQTCKVKEKEFELVSPKSHFEFLTRIKKEHPGLIVVDYTHPSAVNANASLYCRAGTPFVMGTTGGDRQALVTLVEQSGGIAVIAPNMAKQIVAFTAMMEYAASSFPGLFDGWTLDVQESHQQGKADTSGTAKAIVGCFTKMGVDFDIADIRMLRDPVEQKALGVPEQFLSGHGWHTYRIFSPDRTLSLTFGHNVNGRAVYYPGTADAIVFLDKKIAKGVLGQAFSMVDVLKGA
ncbi:MAG: dihydrodipicolinate reductase [Desulfatibacillaceae bacterium]|nr:dihydrodipicolinate reductase [Desulfatibacillaceae bacterium]